MSATTVPLSSLPGPEIRRDRWGRYLIVPPGGGAPVPYTRVTTVAKGLDDGGGLAAWKATMVATGTVLRRGLRARWETLVAEYGASPWYGGDAAKQACKELVEDCAKAGGSQDRAEMGNALHAITALIDAGETPPHLSEDTERDVNAYVDGLAAAGVSVVPGMIELTVVLDEHQVAGTFDRLVTVPGFDLPLIADLKTGANLGYSWQPIALQESAYAHGDAIYRQGPAVDGSEDERLPMPAVDQENGLVMWLNAGTGQLELFIVDLISGWQAFHHSMWARDWRKARIHTPLGPPVDPLGPMPAPPAGELRDWLQGRIDVIGRHPGARHDLGLSWPSDLPTLRAFDGHSADQLAAIEALLDGVESRHSIPFGATRPGQERPIGTLRSLSTTKE